jgi:predicted nucleic acid-binding protein
LIIDTDVLIWHLRGNEKAREIIHESIPFSISVVTYIELIQGMRDKKEMNSLIKQLTNWNVDIIQINQDISARAMIYIEQYHHSSAMELADALIAATCVNNAQILITGNEKHYKGIPNIQIKRFIHE